jgi:hypothetical protein
VTPGGAGGNADAGGASDDTEDASADDASPADAQAVDVARADVTVGPLACANTLTASYVTIEYSSNMLNLPTPTGGTVADGHYVLVSMMTDATPSYNRTRAELWISKGRYELEEQDEPDGPYSYGGTIRTSGTSLVMTLDCGGLPAAPSWQYSASGSDLTAQYTNINGLSFVYGFHGPT